jgi:hypothetical protein
VIRARNRLDAWDRYARILADQLAALDGSEPDLDRFNELARERDLIASEIDVLDRPVPGSPEAAGVVARLRERLETCRTADRAVLDRLGQLRGETRRAVGQMQDRKVGRAGYMTTADTGGQRVDVKS